MAAISSNQYSVDLQAVDALKYIEDNHSEAYSKLLEEFPEIPKITFTGHGSWMDTEAMGVDQEWSSWLIDAIELTGLVIWEEGEPFSCQ